MSEFTRAYARLPDGKLMYVSLGRGLVYYGIGITERGATADALNRVPEKFPEDQGIRDFLTSKGYSSELEVSLW